MSKQATRRRGSEHGRLDAIDANGSYIVTPLDDIREWILGDQASDPRCAPDHRNTTLKVHVGPVSSHVANWEAVEETLRGTRYEHFLSE